jgi:ribosomal protein S2
MQAKKKAYRLLAGKSQGKRPLGRARCRWADNTKLYLKNIRWDGMHWIDLAQDRDQWRTLVNTIKKFRVP